MRRGCGRRPLQRRRLPGIVVRLLALEHAPDEIKVKDYLHGDGNDRGDRHKGNQPMRVLQELVLAKVGVAARHAQHPHRVEGNEDRIDAEERYPEVKLAQAFVQHAAKHLRKPEVGRGEHAEDGRHAHYQVEVRGHKIGIVKEEVERRLAQHQSRDPAGHK